MALHLNLLHEIDSRQRQRRRDPLKISMIVLVVIVLGLAGYYFLRLSQVSRLADESGSIETEWKSSEPKSKIAKTREAELTALFDLNKSFTDRIENRFYWAPVLEKVLGAATPEVQFIEFGGTVNQEGKELCTISLKGLAAGQEPRTVAEELRRALAKKFSDQTGKGQAETLFKALEDSDQKVMLEGKQMAAVDFSIQIGIRRPEVPVQVAPKREAKRK